MSNTVDSNIEGEMALYYPQTLKKTQKNTLPKFDPFSTHFQIQIIIPEFHGETKFCQMSL